MDKNGWRRLVPVVVGCVMLAASAQEPEVTPPESSGVRSAQESSAKRTDSDERQEIKVLLHELEVTLNRLEGARVQVENVKEIVQVLDRGVVKASDDKLVRTNQDLRRRLVQGLRELRVKARNVASQVKTTLLPRQRGLANKLKTRWELEQDQAIKSKIAKLLGEHQQAITETSEQLGRLEANIGRVGAAIAILENQLDYLALVEESLGLSRKVTNQLRDLNSEIDQVLNALEEKEVRQ